MKVTPVHQKWPKKHKKKAFCFAQRQKTLDKGQIYSQELEVMPRIGLALTVQHLPHQCVTFCVSSGGY